MWRITSKQLAAAGMLFFLGGCGCFYSVQQVMTGEAFEDELAKSQARDVSNMPLRNPKSIVV